MSLRDDHKLNDPAAPAVTPMLRAVLVCDIVESTALVERLGDARAAGFLQRHDQLLRQTMALCHGQLVDKADGVLALFERPVQALDFALRYQRGLHELGASEGLKLKARTGIHVGDVMTWANSPADVLAGAKPFEVEGLAKPVAARLMGLAMPGQILMSGMAQNLAQRAAGELGEVGGRLRWLMHGRYRFKGVPAPMLVHEAGEPGIAPLRAPDSGDKAWRELPIWRRPPMLAAEALLLLALGSAVLWSTFRSEPAIAFAERDWVVVAELQNRTEETLFDESLDVALRVGLEQSRHVNLVSELQIDRALARMQRQGQPVDRQLATELALREGARAVILPTVAEVGGLVRVSLEVIDPNSGVTVYSESADGRTAQDVLPALDDTIAGVRERLGESLASIQATSRPLEQATTRNLDALRLFSLGVKARNESRFEEAWDLFERAVTLDPQFSMAYLRMAFMRYSANDGEGLERYLALALEHRDHLTEREALFLDAAAAVPEGPEPAMRKLRLLSTMYPDEYRAYYNYAYFGMSAAQRYRDSLEQLRPATQVQNPARANAVYLQGMLYLSLGDVDASLASFEQAESLGVGGERRIYAEALATARRYDEAGKVLSLGMDTGIQAVDFEQRLPEMSFALDQGRWRQALDAAAKLEADATGVSGQNLWALRGSRLGLRTYQPDAALPADIRSYLDDQLERLPKASRVDRRHVAFNVLAAGWMAARGGDGKSARRALEAAAGLPETERFAANADMVRVVEAELALMAGKPEEAVRLLSARADTDQALFFLHAVLRRALAAHGDTEGALAQAQWLARMRGRAYAEFNSANMWQGVNLVEANIALAAAAEYARTLGQEKRAEEFLARFHRAWPAHEELQPIVRRAIGP